MKREQKNIDKLFRNVLDDFEPDIPDYVWENVKSDLSQRKRQKMVFLIRNIAASILVLLAFGAGYFYSVYKSNNNIAQSSNRNLTNLQNKDNTTYYTNNSVDTYSLSINDNKTMIADRTKNVNPGTNLSNKKLVDVPDIQSNNTVLKKSGNNKIFDLSNTLIKKGSIYTSKEKQDFTGDNQIVRGNSNITGSIDNSSKIDIIASRVSEVKSIYEINQDITKPVPVIQDQSIALNSILLQEKNLRNQSHGMDTISNLKKDLMADIVINQNEKVNKKIWEIGGQISPVFAMNGANSQNEEENYLPSDKTFFATPKNSDQENEKFKVNPKTVFSGGLSLTCQLFKRLKVQTGIYYSKKEQLASNLPVSETKYNSKLASYNIYASSVAIKFDQNTNASVQSYREQKYPPEHRGTPKIDNATTLYELNIDLNQKLEYVELPFILKYKVIDSKMDFNVISGLNTGYLVTNKATVNHLGETVWQGNNENISKFLYTATVGLGMEYPITEKISLNFEPSMKYSVNRIQRNNGAFSNPYSFALFTGVNYSF